VPQARELFPDELADMLSFLCFLFFVRTPTKEPPILQRRVFKGNRWPQPRDDALSCLDGCGI